MNIRGRWPPEVGTWNHEVEFGVFELFPGCVRELFDGMTAERSKDGILIK
jgi:hypothetical protein